MKYFITNNPKIAKSNKMTVEQFKKSRLWNKLDKPNKELLEARFAKPSYSVRIEDNQVWASTSKLGNYFGYEKSFDESWVIY